MKNYQLKVILKNSKPPLWRRCMVPSGITFAQLGIILETILEWVPIDAYEFEFFQAGIQLREWRGEELTLTSYNYDYMCSSDTYIDSLLRPGKNGSRSVYMTTGNSVWRLKNVSLLRKESHILLSSNRKAIRKYWRGRIRRGSTKIWKSGLLCTMGSRITEASVR